MSIKNLCGSSSDVLVFSAMEKNALKADLAAHGISQADFAQRLKMDDSRLSRILSGRVPMPAGFEETARIQIEIFVKAEAARQKVLKGDS